MTNQSAGLEFIIYFWPIIMSEIGVFEPACCRAEAMNSVFRGHQTVARPVREATAASDCLAASVLVPMRTDCRCNDESGRRVDAYTLSLVFFFLFSCWPAVERRR